MEDLNSINILQLAQKWLSSFMGTVTILLFLAVIAVVIIMATKESYGKDSFGFRVVFFVTIAIYAIIALNFAGAFIAGIISSIGRLIVYLLDIKWLTTTILVIIYIIGARISLDTDNIIPTLIAMVILTGGSYGIYQSLPVTIGFGIVSGIITLIISNTIV